MSPAEHFIETMFMLYYAHGLSAHHLCQVFFWAGQAGIAEAVKFGMPPGRQSGKYKRHLDNALEVKEDFDTRTFPLKVVGHRRRDDTSRSYV